DQPQCREKLTAKLTARDPLKGHQGVVAFSDLSNQRTASHYSRTCPQAMRRNSRLKFYGSQFSARRIPPRATSMRAATDGRGPAAASQCAHRGMCRNSSIPEANSE